MKLYKCFNSGLINRYGMNFCLGKEYCANGPLKFGNDGNGFHACTYMEDTLRYFNSFTDKVDIAIINGYGKCLKYDDEYNGFYDMYVCERILIKKVLSRKEIIDYGLKLSDFRLKRFLSLYGLSDLEKDLFYKKFIYNTDILRYIDYYQNNNLYAFQKILKKD